MAICDTCGCEVEEEDNSDGGCKHENRTSYATDELNAFFDIYCDDCGECLKEDHPFPEGEVINEEEEIDYADL